MRLIVCRWVALDNFLARSRHVTPELRGDGRDAEKNPSPNQELFRNNSTRKTPSAELLADASSPIAYFLSLSRASPGLCRPLTSTEYPRSCLPQPDCPLVSTLSSTTAQMFLQACSRRAVPSSSYSSLRALRSTTMPLRAKITRPVRRELPA